MHTRMPADTHMYTHTHAVRKTMCGLNSDKTKTLVHVQHHPFRKTNPDSIIPNGAVFFSQKHTQFQRK